MAIRLVALGGRYGNEAAYVMDHIRTVYPGLPPPTSGECLVVDREDYSRDVQKRGYHFQQTDLSQAEGRERLPAAEIYLAFDFLEHLPGPVVAYGVMEAMLSKATKLVWIRTPSFEPDKINGQGVLLRHKLRFSWTFWTGHTFPVTLRDISQAISRHAGRTGTPLIPVVRPLRLITSTHSEWVVPVDAPIDTIKYSPKLGPRKLIQFGDQPVIGCWDILIDTSPHKEESDVSHHASKGLGVLDP